MCVCLPILNGRAVPCREFQRYRNGHLILASPPIRVSGVGGLAGWRAFRRFRL
jgi:hypothetical protein